MANNIKFRGSNNAKTVETFMGRTLYRSLAYADDLDAPVLNPTLTADQFHILKISGLWRICFTAGSTLPTMSWSLIKTIWSPYLAILQAGL